MRVTVEELRKLIAEEISATIHIHRGSRASEDGYDFPQGEPAEEEISDFIASNPLLDGDLIEQLIDPGFLGYNFLSVDVNKAWLAQFRRDVRSWAHNDSWLAADWSGFVAVDPPTADKSLLWTPQDGVPPYWIGSTPPILLRAVDLVSHGKLLSELHWREFEELVGTLLEKDGWSIELTRPSKDGGVDVRAKKMDATLGELFCLWQAKRYGPTKKVRLSHVKELDATRSREGATKALIVTTSCLTRGALDWIRQDLYRLGYKEHDDVVRLIRGVT